MNTKRVVRIGSGQQTLAALVETYSEAAAGYAKAKKVLADTKKALLPLLGRLPAEGTTHVVVGNHVVVVRTRLTRTIDATKLSKVIGLLPSHVAERVLPVTRKLSLRELRFLEDNDPANYKLVRGAFTATKATPTIEVTL